MSKTMICINPTHLIVYMTSKTCLVRKAPPIHWHPQFWLKRYPPVVSFSVMESRVHMIHSSAVNTSPSSYLYPSPTQHTHTHTALQPQGKQTSEQGWAARDSIKVNPESMVWQSWNKWGEVRWNESQGRPALKEHELSWEPQAGDAFFPMSSKKQVG